MSEKLLDWWKTRCLLFLLNRKHFLKAVFVRVVFGPIFWKTLPMFSFFVSRDSQNFYAWDGYKKGGKREKKSKSCREWIFAGSEFFWSGENSAIHGLQATCQCFFKNYDQWMGIISEDQIVNFVFFSWTHELRPTRWEKKSPDISGVENVLWLGWNITPITHFLSAIYRGPHNSTDNEDVFWFSKA